STSPPSIRPTPTTTPPPSTPFAPFPVATTTTLKLATPTTRPPSPPTTFVGVTATYATDGGTVSVACTGPSTIRLVSATPADGYIVYVVSPGPQYVGLRFQSTSNGVTFAAGCVYGQPLRAANPPPTTTTTSGVPAP
ncbi:MAG: hypothetical protein M3N98_02205, partial [Actinomycetota bacterium]|nr:hypothetical protein [Actinomycetota bacterium]